MTIQTLLIGLDGATFSVLDGLMRDGTMPFLRELIDAGVRADLRSTVPALTPPAWTTLMTGKSPGQHGIFDFFRKEAPGSHNIRFLTSQDIDSPTIWALANHYGRRATVLNFPLTFPAPPIDGYVVPGGWMPWRQLRAGCRPDDLYDRLKTLPGFNPRTLALDMEHEEKALEGVAAEDEYEDWVRMHIRREEQWFEIARYLMREDPTELFAIMFDGVDKIQHLCWRFIDPAYTATLNEREQRVRGVCLTYFGAVDDIARGLVELAGPDVPVVVVSDHGFGPQVRTLFVNTWLEQRGYLRWAGGRGPQTSAQQTLGMSHLAKHSYLLDWNATRAYAPMPSANGIHIVRQDADHPNGVPDDQYHAVRDEIIAGLTALRAPDRDERVVAHVWTREQAFAGPHLELAPDITLELTDGGLISILAGAQPVVPRPQPAGAHRPEGIFIARGPIFRQAVQLSELSILDIAPILMYSMELPIMKDFEGRLPEAAIEPEVLEERPVEVEDAPAASKTPTTAPQQIWDEAGEAEVLRRLQALGYVE